MNSRNTGTIAPERLEPASQRTDPAHSNRTLDVGCHDRKVPGAVGIDRLQFECVDVLYNLDCFPWPFEDNSFGRVVFRHSLAHLEDIVRVMEEVHRITVPDGAVEIVTPHFSSDNAFTDVTSRRFFGFRSLDYFCQDTSTKYRYTDRPFHLERVRLSFVQAHRFEDDELKFNPFAAIGLEWAINRLPRAYEHFLAFVCRANEIYYRLRVIKRANEVEGSRRERKG